MGAVALELDLRHWVNDALMAVFFFVVGLEVKRELVIGELRDRRAATLPVLAAVGGVVVPALVFTAFTAGTAFASGWAIPIATDIAFAVGVLALLGDRVSPGAEAVPVVGRDRRRHRGDPRHRRVLLRGASGSGCWRRRRGVGGALVLAGGGDRDRRRMSCGRVRVGSGARVGRARDDRGVTLGLLTPTGEVGAPGARGARAPPAPGQRLRRRAVVRARERRGRLRRRCAGRCAESRLAWAIVAGLVVGKFVGIVGAVARARLGWGALPDGMRTAQAGGWRHLAGLASPSRCSSPSSPSAIPPSSIARRSASPRWSPDGAGLAARASAPCGSAPRSTSCRGRPRGRPFGCDSRART